ncbi:cryptochrome/photolyase family protein [Cumulibacter manganitolerans]|uniref:cryptochrome/photolyase family protein n=1 Tax=Cumulibacter manganitolerans TaxID=1884992 RepID=UPI0012961645|nr:deoxyribodipyrimidine photo-lyase [Cumulibacter manganitolerans]
MSTALMWFRRDLRLSDHPALQAAAEVAGDVLPLFVRDPALTSSGGARTARLEASLGALRGGTDDALVIRTGDPSLIVPQVAAEVGAERVFISAETTPYGRRRDCAVHRALAADGRELVAVGSPYAVTPGRVRNGDDGPYRVFTAFRKAWSRHGWPQPAGDARPSWRTGLASEPLDPIDGVDAGERAALRRWREFLDTDLASYDEGRDRPDLHATSRMSAALKYGEIHPRTLLADLADLRGEHREATDRYVTELAWREFYADVLFHDPGSAWRDWRPELRSIRYDHDDALVEAWRTGRTGYPFVDAGMRQLLAEGWMHNRLRMVTASFLVKDLHVWWPVGARYFLQHLLDGDLASNNHGWQWVAGTGTDAAPYFRVFNPVLQGQRFDPDGEYVRRWVPELRHLKGADAHEPWRHDDGYRDGYPQRVVDHAEERREALQRLDELKARRP